MGIINTNMPSENIFGELTGSFGGIGGGLLDLSIKILGGLVAFFGIGALLFYNKQKKKFNIPVTVWIPRSDGKITDEVSAKGGFFKTRQPQGGEITSFRLKRKGQKVIDLPPPASRFLVGLSRKLYLVQKGIDDFEPVLPDSFRYAETPEKKKIALINLKCINQDATAWVEDNRESSKRRFTLSGFWEKYKDFIQMTIFLFIVMLALYINWMGMKEVVTGLKDVADALRPAIGSSVNIK